MTNHELAESVFTIERTAAPEVDCFCIVRRADGRVVAVLPDLASAAAARETLAAMQ